MMNKRQLIKETIRELRLIDDILMQVGFKDNFEAVAYILRIIMDMPTPVVTSLHIEHVIPNLRGHAVRFDIHAKDADGREYDIEMQCAGEYTLRELIYRARYNSAMMDVSQLKKGMSYAKLGETYVIFITEEDVLGRDLPIYHIDRTIREDGSDFGDDAHIVFVNCAYKGKEDTPLSRLVADLLARNTDDMQEGPLKETVRRFKGTEAGETKMTGRLKEIFDSIRDESRKEGKIESTKHSIRMVMKNTGATAERAMEILGIDKGSWAKYKAML